MTPGFTIIWYGPALPGASYLTKDSQWTKNAGDAHVFATWSAAKKRSRAFKGVDVVEAWI